MEVTCDNCGKLIKIPDGKIPSGKSFSLRCPACKGKVGVDLEKQEDKTVLQSSSSWQEDMDHRETDFNDQDQEYDANEKPFDFLEEEGFTAMVCETDPEAVKKIKEVLNIMEYSVTLPESIRDALRKMKYHVYNLILVNESFDGSSPDSNGILIYLERLNMSIRRNIFVGLITSRYATRDNMAAFLKSVNLTINKKDIVYIDKILKNAINENELFFTILKESMKKAGKI